MTSAPRVLVTGGSGYIAGVLIRQLLDAGWMINTTVRDLKREPALRKLLGADQGEARERLHCFPADLMADVGWADAAAGCSHVAHLASPLPAGVPRDANELIVPARDGAPAADRPTLVVIVTSDMPASTSPSIVSDCP